MKDTRTTQERLAQLERFADKLVANSYFAKATSKGEFLSTEPMSTADKMLAAHVIGFDRWEGMDQRIKQLERGSGRATQAQGESVLAKAVGELKSGDAILAKASSSGVGPLMTGIIAQHVAARNLPEARKFLLRALDAAPLAKAADPVSDAMNAVGSDTDEDAGEVREAVSRLEQTMATILERLERIEARQRSPRPAAAPTTVAKATQQVQQRRLSPEDFDSYLDSYVDNSTRVGELLEMRRSGDPALLKQAEQYLIAAKRKFETQKIRTERRGFGQ